MRPSSDSRISGFTLVEVSITIAVAMLVGGMVFIFLNAGMNLYAKNTAVNAAHQQARSAVDEMLANIHSSVSIPQLVDGSLIPSATPAPSPSPVPGAAGVSFQKFVGGPFLLWTGGNVSSDQNYIVLYAPTLDSGQSVSGLRLNIPSHKIEQNISSISPYYDYRIIYLAGTVGSDVITKDDGSGNGNGNGDGTSNITAFISRRVSYAVACIESDPVACATSGIPNKELRYFPTNQTSNYKVIARNVTASTPFRILFNQADALDLRSVAAVDLSTAEPQYSKRGYAAVNMFIKSYIPFRSKLTIYQ